MEESQSGQRDGSYSERGGIEMQSRMRARKEWKDAEEGWKEGGQDGGWNEDDYEASSDDDDDGDVYDDANLREDDEDVKRLAGRTTYCTCTQICVRYFCRYKV